MTKIVIVASCVAILAAGLLFLKNFVHNNIVDGPDMVNHPDIVSFSYYRGGDEYDRSESFSMKDSTFRYYKDGGTVGGSTKAEYVLNAEFHKAMMDIINKYNVQSWTNLENSDIEVLDGATTQVTLEFNDGTTVRLGDAYMMPEHGWMAVREIVELFENYMKTNKEKTVQVRSDNSDDDSGMTMLVDYCEKTVATVGGDGYKEIVLYKNYDDGSFSLHTYVKAKGAKDEVHHVYPATAETRKAVFELIHSLKLSDYAGKKGFGIEGAEYVVRFQEKGKTVRVSSNNFRGDGRATLSKVGKLLYSAIENE